MKGAEALWEAYAASSAEDDRNRLLVHYAPLVKYVAGRLAATLPTHVDVDDLLSDGTIGLVTAVERFDPTRSTDFADFAIKRVRGAMIDGLRSWDWLPRTMRSQVKELEAATERLYAELGRPPTDREVATALGIAVDEVGTRQRYRDEARAVPLPMTDVVTRSVAGDGDVPVGAEERLPAVLVRELRCLPERDQVLMALYYFERLTMAEIGRVLGVSESRVSQLHHRIRRELRSRLAGDAPQ
ncbi:FliA/WhiG family RNA polymerase sigma factor [Nocardioides sp. SYSU DS0663]|uniref:FliA/WhiG family RNA polymerase sigma factor n=1 Tax=Nocardioides sp. SYSU DS0663 TaxID=3416445 RepID=UPI003F4C367A